MARSVVEPMLLMMAVPVVVSPVRDGTLTLATVTLPARAGIVLRLS